MTKILQKNFLLILAIGLIFLLAATDTFAGKAILISGGKKGELITSGLTKPLGIAIDSNGDLFCTVQTVTGEGSIVKISGGKVEFLKDIQVKFPGAIGVLKDGSIVTINYSNGVVYHVKSSLKQVIAYPYFYREEEQLDPLTGRPVMAYNLLVDRNMLYVAGECPSGKYGSLGPGLFFITSELGKDHQFDEDNRRMYFKNYRKCFNPLVTALAQTEHYLYVAMDGKGIVMTSIIHTGTPGFDIEKNNFFKTQHVMGMVFDDQGNLYIAATSKYAKGYIYRLDGRTRKVTVFAKGFKAPAGMAIKGEDLYVTDFAAGTVYQLHLNH